METRHSWEFIIQRAPTLWFAIRDHEGCVVGANGKTMDGCFSVLAAELLDIPEGICFCIDSSLLPQIVESYCL
ncbi:hypothetical protein TIFTF001_029882 [Ficus carica]|uniref:RNase H type-1 domain-containing protein n=1 Tax=Ficus carica TaxID=3494 RepID=A0AA88J219_FICCA|nr:hypothetical protein TIFTF001_029882 [Ficus carica]